MIELWVMVFVGLMPDGSVETAQVDMYGTLDDCMMAVEEIVIDAGDPKPWNWDFVCLEYDLADS